MDEMVDMKRAGDADSDIPADGSGMPEYPYGLCIHLDGEDLKKLGITDLPAPGKEFHIKASGQVTRASREAGGDAETSIDVQIMFMQAALEEGSESNETAEDENREEKQSSGVKTLLTSAYRG